MWEKPSTKTKNQNDLTEIIFDFQTINLIIILWKIVFQDLGINFLHTEQLL